MKPAIKVESYLGQLAVRWHSRRHARSRHGRDWGRNLRVDLLSEKSRHRVRIGLIPTQTLYSVRDEFEEQFIFIFHQPAPRLRKLRPDLPLSGYVLVILFRRLHCIARADGAIVEVAFEAYHCFVDLALDDV